MQQAPRIWNRNSTDLMLHKEGDPVSVSVEVTGSPPPAVTWYLGKHPLETSLDYMMRDRGTTYNLYISRVTDEVNEGLSIEARNSGGVDRMKLPLKVYSCKYNLVIFIKRTQKVLLS